MGHVAPPVLIVAEYLWPSRLCAKETTQIWVCAAFAVLGSTRRWRVGDGCQPSRTFTATIRRAAECSTPAACAPQNGDPALTERRYRRPFADLEATAP